MHKTYLPPRPRRAAQPLLSFQLSGPFRSPVTVHVMKELPITAGPAAPPTPAGCTCSWVSRAGSPACPGAPPVPPLSASPAAPPAPPVVSVPGLPGLMFWQKPSESQNTPTPPSPVMFPAPPPPPPPVGGDPRSQRPPPPPPPPPQTFPLLTIVTATRARSAGPPGDLVLLGPTPRIYPTRNPIRAATRAALAAGADNGAVVDDLQRTTGREGPCVQSRKARRFGADHDVARIVIVQSPACPPWPGHSPTGSSIGRYCWRCRGASPALPWAAERRRPGCDDRCCHGGAGKAPEQPLARVVGVDIGRLLDMAICRRHDDLGGIALGVILVGVVTPGSTRAVEIRAV